jgi:hypothetical protein
MTTIAAPMPTCAQTFVKTMIAMTPITRTATAAATVLTMRPVTVRRVYGVASSDCNGAGCDLSGADWSLG